MSTDSFWQGAREAWVLLGPLAGVVVGGATTYWTNRSQRSHEMRVRWDGRKLDAGVRILKALPRFRFYDRLPAEERNRAIEDFLSSLMEGQVLFRSQACRKWLDETLKIGSEATKGDSLASRDNREEVFRELTKALREELGVD